MSPKATAEVQEPKPIEVTQAKSLPDNQLACDEVNELYEPPDPRHIQNKDPNMAYRWLSKARIQRDGGNTRGWQIVQGNDPEYSADPSARIIMQGAGISTDTTRPLGDLVLGKKPKDVAESIRRYYRDKANKAVQEVTVRNEKEQAEFAYKYLRDQGMSPTNARRYMEATGGAILMGR